MALAATHSCRVSKDKMLYWNTPDKTNCPRLAEDESLAATNFINGVKLMLSHEASSTVHGSFFSSSGKVLVPSTATFAVGTLILFMNSETLSSHD